jgi:hypothetical protein
MNGDFDTEFFRFLNKFLAEHPDVIEDQRQEWDHLWNTWRDDAPRDEVEEDAEESGITMP